MDIKSLYLVVEKLIKKKYPWIDGFQWSQYFHDGMQHYTLEIYPSEEFRESEIFLDKYETEIEEEMKSLFIMLGPLSNEKFEMVRIL